MTGYLHSFEISCGAWALRSTSRPQCLSAITHAEPTIRGLQRVVFTPSNEISCYSQSVQGTCGGLVWDVFACTAGMPLSLDDNSLVRNFLRNASKTHAQGSACPRHDLGILLFLGTMTLMGENMCQLKSAASTALQWHAHQAALSRQACELKGHVLAMASQWTSRLYNPAAPQCVLG